MRKYSDSDIFQKMNTNGALTKQLAGSIPYIMSHNEIWINGKISELLGNVYKAYKDSLTLKAIEAVRQNRIILVRFPSEDYDKRFPAHMPYVRVKANARSFVIVDTSKYCTMDNNDVQVLYKIDINKLYVLIVSAYVALEVLNEDTVLPSETMKWLSLLWAKLFNKILMSQKIFVGNRERYEAFMYFAARFFMFYYAKAPDAIVEKVSNEILNNGKNNQILMIESNLRQKNIDLYRDWTTFAHTMFSNDVTNIKAAGTANDINAEQYLRLYVNQMGMDGSYLALWSADYFFYCIFATWNHAYILNDRSWQSVVDDDPKAVPRILRSIYREA